MAADAAFRNARENSDDANARIEHDKVLARIVTGMVKDDAELFKQFMDNEDFKRWMTARVFEPVFRHVTIFGHGHGLQHAIIDESQHSTPER